MSRKNRKNQADTQTPKATNPSFFQIHERRVILILCILAGFRVLIFSAAFPFFNNVDEEAHLDLICKYSVGHVPTRVENFSHETASLICWNFTPEYLHSELSRSQLPLWTESEYESGQYLRQEMPNTEHMTNHESTQPPVYYMVAGAWLRLGQLLHISNGHLLYWLRLIDVPIYAALVWLSWLFARRFYGQNDFIRFGAPMLLVVFPQDVFYSLNNDVLTPLLFGAGIYGLLSIHADETRTPGFHVLTGLAVAAAFLTKFTNLPLLLILAAALIIRVRKVVRAGQARREMPKLALLSASALVPVALWLIRNKIALGDVTGTKTKIEYLGWTHNSLNAILHHPIFTPGGAAYFWSGLMKTFWRGEFVWFGKIVASPGADWMYVISTTLFIAASVFAMRKAKGDERFASVMGLAVFGTSVLFMGALSTLYDYGECFYPSRAHPYLTSGRLISGTMIPFAVLYLVGLDYLMEKVGLRGKRWWALGIIMAAILISESVISVPAFQSLYNLYHMPL